MNPILKNLIIFAFFCLLISSCTTRKERIQKIIRDAREFCLRSFTIEIEDEGYSYKIYCKDEPYRENKTKEVKSLRKKTLGL